MICQRFGNGGIIFADRSSTLNSDAGDGVRGDCAGSGTLQIRPAIASRCRCALTLLVLTGLRRWERIVVFLCILTGMFRLAYAAASGGEI